MVKRIRLTREQVLAALEHLEPGVRPSGGGDRLELHWRERKVLYDAAAALLDPEGEIGREEMALARAALERESWLVPRAHVAAVLGRLHPGERPRGSRVEQSFVWQSRSLVYQRVSAVLNGAARIRESELAAYAVSTPLGDVYGWSEWRRMEVCVYRGLYVVRVMDEGPGCFSVWVGSEFVDMFDDVEEARGAGRSFVESMLDGKGN